MRVFSQGQLAQRLAQVLVAAFVWSAVFSGLAILPAGAQVVTRAATSQSVAVLPFQNLTGYCPDTFGATAADAVAVELRDRLLLDVLPNAEVALQMKNLGMSVPPTSEELVRLATELEVGMIITGEVRQADLAVSRGSRYAEVTLGVLLFDRPSAGTVNGALVTARSPSSLEAAGEDLIAKALKQAAFQAVQEMKTRPTITAMVLWADGDRVFTNTGTRGGVVPGLKMAAIRDGQRIAEVQITSTEATGSYGSVIGGTLLRTGDHLRALFELPGAVRPTLKTRVKREARSWEKPLLTAGILLGLVSMTTAARTLGEGDVAAPDLTSSNLSNSLSIDTAGSSALFLGTGYITWATFSNTQKQRIAGYEVWRGEELAWINLTNWEDPYVFDVFFGFPGSPGGTVVTVDLLANNLSGEIFPTTDGGSWNGVDPETWDDFVDQFQPLGIVGGQDSVAIRYAWVHFPPTPGMRYSYRVKPIIIENHQLPTSPFANWVFVRDATEFSSARNFTTIVAPPATDQALVVGNVATFLFYGPIGADEMVLQVQRDQGTTPTYDFEPSTTLERVITGLDPMDPGFGGFSLQSIQVNLSDMRALPGTSNAFWWRVGARNRLDTEKPRPWPLKATPQGLVAYEYGWVWSYPRNRLELSGAARSALTREQQDRLSAFRTNRVMRVRVRDDNRPMHAPR